MADNSNLVVATFKVHTSKNEAKSKEAGRPIFDDLEVCEIRFAANRQTVAVFPAHDVAEWVDTTDGGREPETYAMRYAKQYQQFKAGEAQSLAGTPLEEAPFLTQAKRSELKALNIYTVESLSMLDGTPLKQLGPYGRELKDQAVAYLAKAAGTADVTKLAADNARMAETIAALQKQIGGRSEPDTTSTYDAWTDSDLKDFIQQETGQRPKGNPSHQSLVAQATEAIRAVA